MELVITFSTLEGLRGCWLLHSLRCEGYRIIGYCINPILRAKGLLVITFSTL